MANLAISIANLKSRVRYSINSRMMHLSYRLRHWAFQWKQDNEGDIAFVVLGRIAFVKYKEHTIVRFDGHKMADAPKYVRGE
jgi:hypothetical protein